MYAIVPECEGDKSTCSRIVGGSNRRSEGGLEVTPHICCKGSDVEVGVGRGEASGARGRLTGPP